MGQAILDACCVLVVSERPLVGETLASMVECDGAFEACTVNALGLADAIAAIKPDIVIIDATERYAAERCVATALDAGPDVKVALLTDQPGMWSNRARRALGVAGLLSCNLTRESFVRSLSQLHNGERLQTKYHGDKTPRSTADRPEDLRIAVLTPREVEVLVLLGLGESPERIARELAISTNTVRTHVQNLMLKLNVHSRLEAVALANKVGLLNGRSVSRAERSA